MNLKRRAMRFALLSTCLLAPFAAHAAPTAALAEPSVSPDGELIAFVSGGDIWEVPASGGTARLLVTDPATEGRPLYSPDGKRLAFTSTRGGNANVYVLDLASGVVTRLSWSNASEELNAWSADGKWVYFASSAQDVGRTTDIFRVAAVGGTPQQVANETYLSEFQSAPSPDGTRLAMMVRGISGVQWWRNGHSHIDDTEIWIKPLNRDEPAQVALADAQKHAWPMWAPGGDALLFMSTASGSENLWRISPGSQAAPEQLTPFTGGRVLFPSISADGRRVVFERDLQIWSLDLVTGMAAPLPIVLRGSPAATPRRHETLAAFTDAALSPDGQKVAVIGHGVVFAGPVKEPGPAQRLSNTAGAERGISWSPDSLRTLTVSERDLDHVLVEKDLATGKETVLTSGGIASVPVYSPDGKSVAYVKNDSELHVLTLAGPGRKLADRTVFTGAVATDGTYGPAPVWSPDGQWVAFPVTDRQSFTNIQVVAAAGGSARPVSFLADGQMSRIAWSPDGKYILFDPSQRTEDSRIVRVDLLPHTPRFKEDAFRELFRPGKQPGSPDPQTVPESGEAPATASAATATKKAAPAPEPVKIVWEGLRSRVSTLPLGLNAAQPVISPDGKTLVFVAQQQGQDNLYSYNLDELASKPPVPQQISRSDGPKSDVVISADSKTVAWLDGGKVFSSPLDTPKPAPIDVSADMDIDFTADRQVVFDEAWSILNRKFFDENFNGRDWQALRARYRPYVQAARNGEELRRIMNLMIGELNASHSGMGRPQRGPEAISNERVGDLAIHLDRAAAESGQGLVVRDVVALGPAQIAGVRTGDRLVSVNGTAVTAATNLDSLLENTVGRQVALVVEGPSGRRALNVQPVSLAVASGLAYRQWVEERRALVERSSGGRLGYVHIADMSQESLDQLYLDLDAQNQSRQGVVIDIRNNNGGFVNGYALDVLARRNFLTMTPRGLFPVPSRQALGQRALGLPTVLVTNESSLSDAEDFTEGYRAQKLGQVVGQPTAGWIIFTSPEPLIDGSSVRVPSTRIRDLSGQDMEMNPRPVDVAVRRDPGQGTRDADAQLAAAVTALLGQIDRPPS